MFVCGHWSAQCSLTRPYEFMHFLLLFVKSTRKMQIVQQFHNWNYSSNSSYWHSLYYVLYMRNVQIFSRCRVPTIKIYSTTKCTIFFPYSIQIFFFFLFSLTPLNGTPNDVQCHRQCQTISIRLRSAWILDLSPPSPSCNSFSSLILVSNFVFFFFVRWKHRKWMYRFWSVAIFLTVPPPESRTLYAGAIIIIL